MTATVSAVLDGQRIDIGVVRDGIVRPPLDPYLEPLAGILHEKLEMTFTARGPLIVTPGGVSWRTYCLRMADTAILLRVRDSLPPSKRNRVASRLRKWVGKEIGRRERLGQP